MAAVRNQAETELKISKEIESLTIHGVSRIITSQSRFLRLVWALLCVSAIVFLIYVATDSLKRYFTYDVFIKEEKILQPELNFPAMTFCNTNFYPIQGYPVDQNLPKNCSYTSREYFKNEINQDYFRKACHWFLAIHPTNNMTSIARIGQYKITSFQFPNHFTFSPYFWPCFTLNRNQTLKQFTDGQRAGFRIILSFDENDYTNEGYIDGIDDERRGMSVAVHDARQYWTMDDTFLPTGFHTKIQIKKRIMSRKPRPFPSNCALSADQMPKSIFPGKQNIKSCLFSCANQIAYKRCGAIPPFMRVFMPADKYPEVFNMSDTAAINCYHDALQYSKECDCPMPCEEEIYETKVSRIPWPQEWQKETLHRLIFRNETYDENAAKKIAKRLIKLSVYYSDLYEYKYTEVEKYGLSSVVGDFGGQMGLFIGASILSVIEVLIMTGKFIKLFFSKRNNVDSLKP